MDIRELLTLRGVDTTKKIKIVRHQDTGHDLSELVDAGLMDLYQSYQPRAVFECDYIISFLGWEGSKARFLGVYKVAGRKNASEKTYADGDKRPLPWFENSDGYFYELEDVPGLEDLKLRIVIHWPEPALAWHRYLRDLEIVEILPVGYEKKFPGYFDLVLSYPKLVKVINDENTYRDWHRMLSAVKGIYLITDTRTGLQYVGSAYGAEGILGRWKAYASSPDGGNKKLQDLLAADPAYASNFQFSILQTLDPNLTDPEVIAWENLYKQKLGPRAYSLNAN
jgi:hypothetical protein